MSKDSQVFHVMLALDSFFQGNWTLKFYLDVLLLFQAASSVLTSD